MAENISVLDYEWHCPSCTFINKAGSFKCRVCGTPKGTSTRQVKFHMSALEQRYVAESFQFRPHSSKSSKPLQNSLPSSTPLPNVSTTNDAGATSVLANTTSVTSVTTSSAGGSSGSTVAKRKTKSKCSKGLQSKWPKLPNLDRTSKRRTPVTVNGVTVIITEYDTLYSDSD